MIQPGQKLREGDYIVNLTHEQWKDVIRILDSPVYPIWEYSVYKGLMFGKKTLLHIELSECETEYNFADFKHLCENTFQNH